MLGDPGAEPVVGAERLYELPMDVAGVEAGGSHDTAVDDFVMDDGEAESITPRFECLLGGWHDEGEMIETGVFLGAARLGKQRSGTEDDPKRYGGQAEKVGTRGT